jgi:hypothetical protein
VLAADTCGSNRLSIRVLGRHYRCLCPVLPCPHAVMLISVPCVSDVSAPRRCVGLSEVVLRRCYGLDDQAVLRCTRLPQLRKLDLHGYTPSVPFCPVRSV